MINELLLIISGIVIATAAMSTGIGGGILWAPLLILAYQLPTAEAVATSLLIQVVGLGSGSISYIRLKLVEKKLVFLFILVAIPGLLIGSMLTVKLPQYAVQMTLGIMSLLIALLFVATQRGYAVKSAYHFDFNKIKKILPIPGIFAFFMGFLSTGIGEWLIPAMRNHLNLDMKRCVATVVIMMFTLAIIASALHWYQAESFHTNYLIWGAIGTAIGGQIGPRIAKYINERVLKETFIFLMTLIGIHLIFQAI